MHLPAVFACKVLLQLTQSSTIILSSDSTVSCFCWPARCLLYFPSACGASIHEAFTRGLVSAIACHMESVFDLLTGYYGIAHDDKLFKRQSYISPSSSSYQIALSEIFFNILMVTYLNVQSNIAILVLFLDHYTYTGTLLQLTNFVLVMS